MSTIPSAIIVLLILAAFCGGFLAGHGIGKHLCLVCGRPLPRVCADGRCGGTPGLSASSQTHGIYSTAVGDDAAVIMCECGWTVEMDTLAQARAEHTVHVAQVGGAR